MTATETTCAVIGVWIALLIVAVLVIRFFPAQANEFNDDERSL